MWSQKPPSSLFSLHCGLIILTCDHKSCSDNWSFFFFLIGHKKQNKMKQRMKTYALSLPMARKHWISSFPVFVGGIFALHSVCYVAVWWTSDFFPLFPVFVWRAYSWETDGWALVCAVNVLSTGKLSVCSGSRNSKSRQTSGSHIHLLAYCKSYGPRGRSRLTFSGLIFATQDERISCFVGCSTGILWRMQLTGTEIVFHKDLRDNLLLNCISHKIVLVEKFKTNKIP